VRTQLLTVFPPGTPRAEIVGRLATAGVRKSGGTVQEEPSARTIFLRTGGVQRAFVVHEFTLTFTFGPDDLLTDIKVGEWRTGP
jgi:hypothetical protein